MLDNVHYHAFRDARDVPLAAWRRIVTTTGVVP